MFKVFDIYLVLVLEMRNDMAWSSLRGFAPGMGLNCGQNRPIHPTIFPLVICRAAGTGTP